MSGGKHWVFTDSLSIIVFCVLKLCFEEVLLVKKVRYKFSLQEYGKLMP